MAIINGKQLLRDWIVALSGLANIGWPVIGSIASLSDTLRPWVRWPSAFVRGEPSMAWLKHGGRRRATPSRPKLLMSAATMWGTEKSTYSPPSGKYPNSYGTVILAYFSTATATHLILAEEGSIEARDHFSPLVSNFLRISIPSSESCPPVRSIAFNTASGV